MAMQATIERDRRAIVDLFPQVLRSWSRGWDGMQSAAAAIGLTPPAFFLLRGLVQARDPDNGITRAGMQQELDNPYSTFRPALDHLPALVAAGYLARDGDRYTVTPAGHDAYATMEAVREAYLATLHPIPDDALTRLVQQLQGIADRLWIAPEPGEKMHQARSYRTPPTRDAAPMVRLIHAVYCLWGARDDAHIAAWRAAGFDGPTFDLLSHVWSGDAATLPALIESVQQFQRPDDVRRGVETLIANGYLARDGDALRPTERGRTIRDAIEAETDRIYFAPWPPYTAEEIHWLRTTMGAVITGLVA
jgi:hypothetical protein